MGPLAGRRTPALAALAAAVGTAGAATLWLSNSSTPTADSLATASDSDAVLVKLRPGDCLTWPPSAPEQISVVDCSLEHRFEVAASQDPDPARSAPSGTPQPQVDHEQCQAAVGRYLGPRYDPNGLYTVGVLWSAETAPSTERIVCGLQLPGRGGQQLVFKGRVADLDQSKVWPAGTCLGINAGTKQSTDIPVDCSAPHAVEVTGAVNLRDAFAGQLPADTDQDAFIADGCSRITDAYLGPVALRTTGLVLAHSTLAPQSWAAGSRQVACRIGAPTDGGGLATLTGSARGPLSINGRTTSTPPLPTSPTPTPAPAPTLITGQHSSSPTAQQAPVPHGTEAPPDADTGDAPLGPAPGPSEGAPSPPPADPPAPPAPAEPPAAPPAPAEPPAAPPAPPAPAPAQPAP
ncbi:MAG: septum formation family protein [Mycobacteriaceae bacterium]|nr:septum formation family protein [Mycobacteriaceae bacterium]